MKLRINLFLLLDMEYDKLLNSNNSKTDFIQEIAKKIIFKVDSKQKTRQNNEKKIQKALEFKEIELPSYSHDEFTQVFFFKFS